MLNIRFTCTSSNKSLERVHTNGMKKLPQLNLDKSACFVYFLSYIFSGSLFNFNFNLYIFLTIAACQILSIWHKWVITMYYKTVLHHTIALKSSVDCFIPIWIAYAVGVFVPFHLIVLDQFVCYFARFFGFYFIWICLDVKYVFHCMAIDFMCMMFSNMMDRVDSIAGCCYRCCWCCVAFAIKMNY